jgi:hypothetical protein
MAMKSRVFDHLTVQWTVQTDKKAVDVTILLDNLLVKKGTTVINMTPFTWNSQVNLSTTSGWLCACMIPSDNYVNLQVMFKTVIPGQAPQIVTMQLDRWSL